MPHAGYPVGSDVSTYLTECGFPVSANLTNMLDGYALSGKQMFETKVNRQILATTQTRKFDPPTYWNQALDLEGDLISASSVTAMGITQVAATDYLLGPYDALQRGQPYVWIEFLRWWNSLQSWATKQSIVITGQWGWAATVPDDVWDAVIAAAILKGPATMVTMKASGGGINSFRTGDVQEDWGISPGHPFRAHLRETYNSAVASYTRVQGGV